MKNMKKIIALLLAAVMVMAMGLSAFAAEDGDEPAAPTGSITITVPTTETAPTVATKYTIYKVFDATVNADDNTKVSYTLCSGDTLSQAMIDAGFSVDANGNVSGPTSLDDAAIKAIAAYVTDSDIVKEVTAAVGDTTVTADGLPYGYYYITTTSGSVVTIDSNNNNPTVADKNVIPTVKKSAGTQYDAASLAAIAAVGTDQPFTAQITKTHGAINLVFEDTMTNLSYNNDVAITVSEGTAPTAAQAVVATTESGFKVTFDNDYIAGLKDGTVITLNYSGKVTSDALSVNPATNKATLTSGEGNKSESDEVDVYNAKFTVTKQDDEEKPLEGAGFVIKNADGKYYKLAEDKKSISWVDSIDDATEYKSDAQGAVPAFTGLGVGKYTLVEKTVPGGYNKAADLPFEIVDKDYTTENLEQSTTVTNESGTELPSTGGIGTTMFYIAGSVLVIGAAVLLISKRRMAR